MEPENTALRLLRETAQSLGIRLVMSLEADGSLYFEAPTLGIYLGTSVDADLVERISQFVSNVQAEYDWQTRQMASDSAE